MKKKSILFVFICILSFSINSNASILTTDEFEITPTDQNSFNESASKSWDLNYNSDYSFTIALMKTKKGKEYVVYSKYFEVSYACCKHGFGVKDVRMSWSKLEDKYQGLVLDPQKKEMQEVITTSELSEAEALNLIANYLPDLIKPEYKYLVN